MGKFYLYIAQIYNGQLSAYSITPHLFFVGSYSKLSKIGIGMLKHFRSLKLMPNAFFLGGVLIKPTIAYMSSIFFCFLYIKHCEISFCCLHPDALYSSFGI